MTDLLNVTNAPVAASSPAKTVDLSQPGERAALARRIKADIDEYCKTAYDDGPRSHLGASLIGHECAMYLWATFRWLNHVPPEGRLARLFNRGHREEARFVEWLKGIGFTVEEVDENGNQHRIKAVKGHFGGSLDGRCKPPAHYNLPEALAFLNEFKTNGTGPKFVDLKTKGVAVAKPQHFRQMSMYGKHYGYKYAIYMNINKNDDDLHVEVVELDWRLAEDDLRKAEEVIEAKRPPPKVSQSEAFYVCKGCDFNGICFKGQAPQVNCRSCSRATPVDNGEWLCDLYGIIPKDFLPKGCKDHLRII